MERNKLQEGFNKIGWNFKEILDAAKDMKPTGWIIVTNKNRLSFMEVSLGQEGPASVEKQFVLDENLEVETYIGGQRMDESVFPFKLSKIRSSSELYICLKLFSSYGLCQGNKNFKRVNNNGEINEKEYWRDTNCNKVYDKSLKRPENCCDACLQLNQLLPKKINNTYLSLNQPYTIRNAIVKHRPQLRRDVTKVQRQNSVKRKKLEVGRSEQGPCIETHFVTIKEEPIF